MGTTTTTCGCLPQWVERGACHYCGAVATTAAEGLLLDGLRAAGGVQHVRGASVVVARRLAARGVLMLRDDGSLGRCGTNVDGERWTIALPEHATGPAWAS